MASKVPTDQTVGTSNDCSTAFVGDFGDMVMGVRLNVQLMASEQASDGSSHAFTHFEVWIRAVARVDFAVLRPSSFVAITGIRP